MSISGIKLTKCRLCESIELKPLIDFGSIPLGNNLNHSQSVSLIAEKYPLSINKCLGCGHFQLSFSVDKQILYKKNYSYLSSIGKKFVDHLEWSSKDILLLQKHDRKSSKDLFVIDIGSNDGTALSFFQKEGCKVLGVDPSNLPVQEALKKNIETINNFFDTSLSEEIIQQKGQADIVISHNVLAHVENLKNIFLGIFKILKDDGLFVFEIGYFAHMISDDIYDTIYHEHLDYHTIAPLVKFLNSIGFNLINVKVVESQGGSLRLYCSKSGSIGDNQHALQQLLETEEKLLEQKYVERWYNRIFRNAKNINNIINKINFEKGKIYGYGAPTKATLACKIIDIKKNDICEILEDNEIKVGRHLPALGIPIVSKFNLEITSSDLIICFAWNFLDAIINNIREQYGENISIISTQNGKIYKT
jgi:SAM-dependent methyltransferase